MMIMKKHLFFAIALAGLTLAGCSSDDFIAETPPVNPTEDAPILFNSSKGILTRSASDITGAAAAELLGNKFVVSGYKGAKTNPAENIVFDNYAVEYRANTAYTTESNTRNWEYVGVERIKHAIDNGITNQTIKYWDYSKPQYDFMAWSTGTAEAIYEGTPAAGQVLVSAITPATAFGPATNDDVVAYTMTGAAADLEQCYISDIKTVKKNEYGTEAVTLRFRSLGSKVRIGIYETVPGYSVRDVEFYSASAVALDGTKDTPQLFSTVANNIFTQGKYTIFFPTVDSEGNADNNVAHIRFEGTGDQSTIVNFGALQLTIPEDGEKTTGNVYIGRTSNTASMAGEAEGNFYTQYLPNESGTNLNLRVNFVLESTDGSGEVIYVKGATAQVPSIYTQWKAGYAYTYLFKISDRTNGYTGDNYDPLHPDDTTINSDPTGLYPITFDAVVVNSEEENTQETITTVSTPSITTYQKGSNVLNNDEYTTGEPIFVTVNDGVGLPSSTIQVLTDKARLYTLPALGTYTEADVIAALNMQDDDAEEHTIKGRSGLVLTEAAYELTNVIEYGCDGNTIQLSGNQALKFTPAAGTNYAFIYEKEAPSNAGTEDKYQPVSLQKGADLTNIYRHNLVSASGDVQKGVKYFSSRKKDMVTVFLGQTVNNLYLDNTGTTIASGYAVTGTDYYYTVDHGQNYQKAKNIPYAEFKGTTLYTLSGNTYTEKPATLETPENGVAYYYKETNGSYTYCVILPQQANGTPQLYVQGTDYELCQSDETAVIGMDYFDKFTINDGVYYTKVIKVQ